MSAMASQISGVSSVCVTVSLDWHQRNYQNLCYWPFVRGIHQYFLRIRVCLFVWNSSCIPVEASFCYFYLIAFDAVQTNGWSVPSKLTPEYGNFPYAFIRVEIQMIVQPSEAWTGLQVMWPELIHVKSLQKP